MTHERNWPAEAWHFDREVPVSLSDRYGELISIAGTVALDTRGVLRAPGDLDAQLELVMDDIERVVEGARARMESVAKLAAFYVGEGAEARVLHAMAKRFPDAPRPALTAVPVANLAFPGMMVEIEGFALADSRGAALAREAVRPGVLRCGDWLYVEGRAARGERAEDALERLQSALRDSGAETRDVVRLNVYYAAERERDDLHAVGGALAGGFEAPGPVVTFVPLPALGDGRARVEIDAIAMLRRDGVRPRRVELPAAAPWRWPDEWPFVQALRSGEAIFIGGQPAFDAARRILHPGDMVAQTRLVMDRIVEMLHAFGATYDDVMKVGCWYNGGASVETLWRNAEVRTSYVTAPGPTSTGVPVNTRYHPQLEIQVDIVAMAPAGG